MGNRFEQDEATLIEGTIADLEESITHAEDFLKAVSKELEEKRERLAIWQRKLAKVKANITLVNGQSTRLRRRPGENLRTVTEYLETQKDGRTISDIAGILHVPWSSIRKTLQANPELFLESNKLWYLAPRKPAQEGEAH